MRFSGKLQALQEDSVSVSASVRILEPGFSILGTIQNLKDRYFLKSLAISSADGTSLFRAKLEGGYDWMQHFNTPQR
jgi:hypothetical protein